MGREIISLHFGQAGAQIGSAIWELFCIEHQLNAEGQLITTEGDKEIYGLENMSAFFCEGSKTWSPRAVMIDLEPSVIDEIRSGPYRTLWRPRCLITGKEDAANNYGRGNRTIGQLKLEQSLDAIRRLAEESSHLAAFEIIHSHSGGTGSGMTSLLVNQLCDEYGKIFKFSTSVFPSSTYSQSTVDPYNSVLHTHSLIETLDCAILFDNQSIFARCAENLHIKNPSYTEINRILAQMLSSAFLSHRFMYQGSQRSDTTELLTNLIPYPRIHFPVLSYAPLDSQWYVQHDKIGVADITKAVFSEASRTIDFSCQENAYISCAMLYRGLQSPKLVYDALKYVKGSSFIGANFVDWCPTGFKIGLTPFPPMIFPQSPLGEINMSVCMLAGNLGIRHVWRRNNAKFDMLFSRRSFLHWFVGEGMEEMEFTEAREELASLEQDYAELMSETIQAIQLIEPPETSNSITPLKASDISIESSIMAETQREPSSLLHSSTAQEISFSPHDLIPSQVAKISDSIENIERDITVLNESVDSKFLHPVTPPDQKLTSSAISVTPLTNRVETSQIESGTKFFGDGELFENHLSPNSRGDERFEIKSMDNWVLRRFTGHRLDSGDIPEITSNYSGIRSTDFTHSVPHAGFNMNNARHSQTSTGFQPTVSMVQKTDQISESLHIVTKQFRNIKMENQLTQVPRPHGVNLTHKHHKHCKKKACRLGRNVSTNFHQVADKPIYSGLTDSAFDLVTSLAESEVSVTIQSSECLEKTGASSSTPDKTSGYGSMSNSPAFIVESHKHIEKINRLHIQIETKSDCRYHHSSPKQCHKQCDQIKHRHKKSAKRKCSKHHAVRVDRGKNDQQVVHPEVDIREMNYHEISISDSDGFTAEIDVVNGNMYPTPNYRKFD